MDLLFRVLYAAHAHGTHHRLALDGLLRLEGPEARAWQRLFLKHAKPFVTGSKAPDTTFKDFKNHVLHPRDGYWGGAPAAAREWYGKLVAHLAAETWGEAAYAAGVLSHYVTDPVHPFHTAQSEAERSIHRAFEWSTAKSYEALKAAAGGVAPALPVLGDGPDWLEAALRSAAAASSRHYEKLIAHYDITRGVVDPPAGLDRVAQPIVGGLIGTAAALFAAVLGRALAEAGRSPPPVTLTLEAVLATLEMPARILTRRIADAADRREVERIYDELTATGTVEKALPEDDRAIRALHRAEVLDARPQVAPPKAESAPPRAAPPPEAVLASLRVAPRDPTPARASQRPRLAPSDPIVDAPSIGPRTAGRLGEVGIATVADLLAADAASLAGALAFGGIDQATVTQWQAQAALACGVPGLSGTGAQLLVGAGFRTTDEVGAADPDALAAAVLRFARTPEGQRVLRDGEPPDIGRIKRWAEAARAGREAA